MNVVLLKHYILFFLFITNLKKINISQGELKQEKLIVKMYNQWNLIEIKYKFEFELNYL